ncbi:MAG: AraC family transcriptional regulator [Steroidobacteraceae bacterium]
MTDPPVSLREPPDLPIIAAMDALSDVLQVLRLSGAVFLDAEFTAPWCVTSNSHQGSDSEHIVFFHWLIAGSCKARLKSGGDIFEVAAGDLLMMPRDDMHLMGSDLHMQPIDAGSLVNPVVNQSLQRIEHGGGGETTRFVCGFLSCDKRLCRPLLEALPGMLRVPFGNDPTATWFRSLLQLGTDETSAKRPGSDTVLAKLSELLFVEAIRRYGEALPDAQTGWLAGLRDRYVGKVLTLMHQSPGHPWTMELLAGEAGLSRSALAQRFTDLIGQPPMQYLTRWRLTVAAQRLRSDQVTLATIAEQIGYDSEAAFNRAFKREFGMPPAAWRRQQA